MRFSGKSELTTANMAASDILAGTDVSSGDDKKVTLSGLAKWIIEYYNGSTLGGSAQTVKSAIDNGGGGGGGGADASALHPYSGDGSTLLTTTTDANALLHGDVHWVNNVGVPSNIPFASTYGRLIAFDVGDDLYTRQFCLTTSGLYTRRNTSKSNLTWTDWALFSDSTNSWVFTLADNEIASGTDLNTITSIGSYRSSGSAISSALVNSPISDQGFVMHVMYGATSNHLHQLIISAKGDKMYIRRIGSGSGVTPEPWTDISGGIPAPASASAGDFLVYNGTAWTAQSLSTWQGGSY